MENPWKDLPEKPPFVLPSDKEAIKAFNVSANENHEIRSQLLPEPYLGRVDAEIILLNLNPAFGEFDAAFYKKAFVRNLWRKNILHEPLEYPFYLLDENLFRDYPTLAKKDGPGWWSQKLKQVIESAGQKEVANRICGIEFFPSYSRRYKYIGHILESQKYGFDLVKQAMQKNAIIIMMQGEKAWLNAVAGLENYPKRFNLNSKQNVAITRKNCPKGFPEIERVLQGAA